MSKQVSIIVEVSGGICQSVYTDSSDEIDFNVEVIDRDNERVDQDIKYYNSALDEVLEQHKCIY